MTRDSLFSVPADGQQSKTVPPQRVRAHPKEVGDASQAMILVRLVQAGMNVLVPFGENVRYDYVVEERDGTFTRVQCKTGRMRDGVVIFPTCSVTYHHPNNRGMRAYRHDYRKDADLFGVYCPETDAVYLVPVNHVGPNSASLRVESTRNNQIKKIRWASDYELTRPG